MQRQLSNLRRHKLIKTITRSNQRRFLPLALEGSENRTCWGHISRNKNITLDCVNKNPNLPWKYYGLSGNPNLTMEYIIKNFDFLHWPEVCKNPSVTWEDITNNPELPWDWRHVVENPNITWEIVKENFHLFEFCDLLPGLAVNPNMTLDHILCSGFDWNWRYVSQNPNITMDEVIQHPDEGWWWSHLSGVFPLKYIIDHPEKSWNWSRVSESRHITLEDIIKHPPDSHIHWDWYEISINPNITWEKIVENYDKPWVPFRVSANCNLTIEIVKQNLDYYWDWFYVCNNIFEGSILKVRAGII